MKKPLIVIAGATACGKTASSVQLARQINGQIISADSMQAYKYMDIGTAKITENEKKNIKHYFIDEIYPDEDFSVSIFKKRAKKYIKNIYEDKKIPILVGGTGFYINSVIYDNDFTKMEKNNEYRDEMYKIAKEKGEDFLHNMLKNIDYISYEKIHKNNVKKVVRALEYYKITGKKISKHNEDEKKKSLAYNVYFFVLNIERNILYERINKRVDIMMQNGLLGEVRHLLDMRYKKQLVSMQGIGYKEMLGYIYGEYSLEEAVDLIKKNTRHFAKRQITWFKNQVKDAIWIDTEKFKNTQEIANYMENIILKK